MYTNYNRDAINGLETSTKYTEYLQTLSNGDLSRGVENYYTDGAGSNRSRRSQRRSRRNLEGSTPLLPTSDNEVKFANIFSPNESNALKHHLLQKTSSLPLLDPGGDDNSNARGDSRGSAARGDDDSSVADHQHQNDPRLRNRRRSTALGLLHENNNNNNNTNSRRKGDPVANILYSTIRHGAVTNNNNNGNDYDNPSADETLHTGSDSKVDYDPHEPLATVDQIALRHELLNNIRAISRATYFEDLYMGKVRKNSGSPEGEILRLLENQNAAVVRSVPEDTLGETTIPSKDTNLSRVDRWVKESSQSSSRAAQHSNNDTDEDNKAGQHASLYHQSVWNGGQGRERKKSKGKKGVSGHGRVGGVSDATTDSDGETPSTYVKRSTEVSKYHESSKRNTINEHDSPSAKHFTKNTDGNVVSKSMGKPFIPPGLIPSSSSYLQTKYLNDSSPSIYKSNERFLVVDASPQHGARRPFSFGVDNSTDENVPLSVSLPNVAQNVSNPYRPPPLPMHASLYRTHAVSGAESLTHSMANLSTGTTYTKNTVHTTRLDKRKLRATSDEQVGRRTMAPSHQKSQQLVPKAKNSTVRVIRQSERTVPGLYTRLNMNQWVVKKVCFYVNGDELHPRFEYRFRPGKDIRDLDQLLDLLTKRFPALPTGARYIFTMDGYHINSLDELINESSYVVSSIRKFKAIKYGNGQREGENFGSGVFPDIRGNKKGGAQRGHNRLSRQFSASDGNLHKGKRDETLLRGQSFANQKAISSLNSKSVSDVPKLVAHVIEEASSNAAALNRSPLMARETIRIINGSRPSLQSQVLLNTKTSQPFEDLVKDLALSVQVPKQPIGNCLKTLAGRQIKSYSQLRSELRAGQRAFFVYSETNKPVAVSTLKPNANSNRLHANGKPVVKAALGKVNSNSSSDLSTVEDRMLDTKRKSHHHKRRSHSPIMNLRTHSRLVRSSKVDNSRSPSPYNYNK